MLFHATDCTMFCRYQQFIGYILWVVEQLMFFRRIFINLHFYGGLSQTSNFFVLMTEACVDIVFNQNPIQFVGVQCQNRYLRHHHQIFVFKILEWHLREFNGFLEITLATRGHWGAADYSEIVQGCPCKLVELECPVGGKVHCGPKMVY